jgi:hypothetical protein
MATLNVSGTEQSNLLITHSSRHVSERVRNAEATSSRCKDTVWRPTRSTRPVVHFRGAVVCVPADRAACIYSVRPGLRVAPLLLGCSGSGRHPVSESGTGSPIRGPRACAARVV